MFDLGEFFKTALVGSVPLILVVLGLVEWMKSVKVPSVALPYVSMGIGLVFGGAYEVSLKMPVDFAGWFAVVVFGLLVGLVASGIYKVGVNLANQAK